MSEAPKCEHGAAERGVYCEKCHSEPKTYATLDWYKEAMPKNADYAALAFRFRKAGGHLAAEAARTVWSWDGHHRLLLAIANWMAVVANERSIKTGDEKPYYRPDRQKEYDRPKEPEKQQTKDTKQ
jgi:hypothetical protein